LEIAAFAGSGSKTTVGFLHGFRKWARICEVRGAGFSKRMRWKIAVSRSN
jgi:hypothetical protein